ncbi:aminoacyl tRNA synthase complex-interacting multifunctional protein 1 [Telopea speciosissima]|uniref:aminoacyl tRNA synthase complex-interacting multifunctional protein 1 n=1 Tax=Telopea speciosissima TaxID=54955 RepID=UPI001CC58664|nr:aminoacyl tRNA synthase complex-interacting multifunctional protein 1 [Telopea speciosissima]
MARNGSANDSILHRRKEDVVRCLCKYLHLDPKRSPSEIIGGNDLKELFSNILKVSGNSVDLGNKEVMKWLEFAESFPTDAEACNEVLKGLNEELIQRSVLLGNGLKPTEVDIFVFSVLYSFVSGLSISERLKFPHVIRWMDYIQCKEDLLELFEKKISVERTAFEPPCPQSIEKVEASTSTGKNEQNSKNVEKTEADLKPKKSVAEKKAAEEVKTTERKNKLPEKVAVEKDMKAVENDIEVPVSLLNVQVGLIIKAWKHPSADSLLVEEIDLGDGNKRQVVSGLAKYCSPDELINRHVVLITNVKPGKLRDVMSAGLVLCASNQDHTVVEPLLPPEGAKCGERISFSGHDGKPEDVLNPKKKQLEKITPHFYTDDKGVATFKGIPFMTSTGPCTSSIPNAGIK